MNIALDWDGTVTRDPELWQEFVTDAVHRGHRIFILTKRYLREPVSMSGAEVIYCCRRPKMEVLNERGIRIDVYIDNNPLDLFN